MNFKLFLLVILSFWFTSSKAQNIKLGLQTGYGFYNMSSLKDVSKNALNQLPFEAKIVSDYPPYFYYQPTIRFSKNNFEYGITYLFQTTGSRISSKDYSGEYRFDTKINSNGPGIFIDGIIADNKDFETGLFLQAGINLSKLKVNEYLQIDSLTNSTDYKFTSHSFYLEPGINFSYSINHICFELNFGYHKEMSRINFSQSGSNSNEIPLKTDFLEGDMWDGFRLGITFSYILFTSNESEN